MDRILGQELTPGGEGQRVVLLRLIGTAQQVLGLRQLLALAAAGIGQKLLQGGRGIGRAAAVHIALGDFQVGPAGVGVLGEAFQECPQRGGAEVQLLVVLRVGDVPGSRQVELGIGQAWRLRIDVLGQQVLPHPPRLAGVAFRQAAGAQSPTGLDIQRARGVVLAELLEERGRGCPLIEVLLALADEQFDLDLPLRLGPGFQGLLVELQGLGVIGFPIFLGRLEVGVGKLQVDVGNLLLAIGREQEFGLGPIDQLGAAEVAFAGQRDGLGKACPACPGALGKLLAKLIEDGDGLVVLAVEVQGPALEIEQVVARGVFHVPDTGSVVDGLYGIGIAAVLHCFADDVRHQRGIG